LRYEDGGKEIINVYPADFRFYNSVVWGSKEEEFGMRFGSGASLNLALVNSLLRTKQETILNAQNQTNLLNINPQFTAPEKFDFTPKIGSPLIDAGDLRFAPTDDATGKGRIGLPDIGAFEYRPN
jgi:hypothetical protein